MMHVTMGIAMVMITWPASICMIWYIFMPITNIEIIVKIPYLAAEISPTVNCEPVAPHNILSGFYWIAQSLWFTIPICKLIVLSRWQTTN